MAEVLLCVFVLAVAVIALLATLAYASRARTVSTERLQASAAATEVMAVLENRLKLDFDQAVNQSRTAFSERLSYTVDRTDLNPDLSRLKVEVFYRDLQGGQEGVYRLETLRHRR